MRPALQATSRSTSARAHCSAPVRRNSSKSFLSPVRIKFFVDPRRFRATVTAGEFLAAFSRGRLDFVVADYIDG